MGQRHLLNVTLQVSSVFCIDASPFPAVPLSDLLKEFSQFCGGDDVRRQTLLESTIPMLGALAATALSAYIQGHIGEGGRLYRVAVLISHFSRSTVEPRALMGTVFGLHGQGSGSSGVTSTNGAESGSKMRLTSRSVSSASLIRTTARLPLLG